MLYVNQRGCVPPGSTLTVQANASAERIFRDTVLTGMGVFRPLPQARRMFSSYSRSEKQRNRRNSPTLTRDVTSMCMYSR